MFEQIILLELVWGETWHDVLLASCFQMEKEADFSYLIIRNGANTFSADVSVETLQSVSDHYAASLINM